MSKRRLALFILMNVVNYLPVLFSMLFYDRGGLVVYPVLLVLQIALIALNALAAFTTAQQIVLSVQLLIATVAANILSIFLYIYSMGGADDIRTELLVLLYVLGFGCLLVIGASVGAIFLKRVYMKSKQNRVTKRVA